MVLFAFASPKKASFVRSQQRNHVLIGFPRPKRLLRAKFGSLSTRQRRRPVRVMFPSAFSGAKMRPLVQQSFKSLQHGVRPTSALRLPPQPSLIFRQTFLTSRAARQKNPQNYNFFARYAEPCARKPGPNHSVIYLAPIVLALLRYSGLAGHI